MMLGIFNIQAHNRNVTVADIDLDGVSDTVRIDREAGVLICKLSRSKFKPRKSRPMQSLTSDDYEFVSLASLPGRFILLLYRDNSSGCFIFAYDEKRKKVYLEEYWAESPGDDRGIGAYEFTHKLSRSCVYYWVRHYKGSTDSGNYGPTAFHTEKVDKPVRKLRMRFEKFSDEKYYRKTRNIRKHIPAMN